MNLSEFDYELPQERIAQFPHRNRDDSRLLVVDRKSGKVEDRFFHEIVNYLRAGDVLVLNDSRVINARLIGEKKGTGAKIELFLLKPRKKDYVSGEKDVWECLARPAKRLKPGDMVLFGENGEEISSFTLIEMTARVIRRLDTGGMLVKFKHEGEFSDVLDRLGRVPLPPYIKRTPDSSDTVRYQTVYAKVPGSAAAPTAGLHFTSRLLDEIRDMGVETVFVTLHVGLGTFLPVKEERIEDHQMHTEAYHISRKAARIINNAKKTGGRIFCVGTTSVRTLESASVGGKVVAGNGRTDIFLYPGGPPFRMTDALVTNFHLPKSTLLMLVSAFYDREKVLDVYRDAVKKAYRFFSYGDAMLIL
ncbi:MAG: tRNA preQ1(34) S-adenosylmethionine ribosyltransferase-isomerase QueA [Clostridiales Family XIII bacterium]|jgi:S-adenosylmethionine:tRNA ribosyltransferase-isomerase|nr:tRNA preQ1(34) S-adenosylmethionine ribosyltransferase-isomerase QueA [Clostridiales Family XIII bacterium]